MEFLSRKFKEKYNSKGRSGKIEHKPARPVIREAAITDPLQSIHSDPIVSEPAPKPPIEQVYNPFPLLPNSAFNPSSLSQKKLDNLHPILKAKYAAYTRPNADIEYEINKSEERSKLYLSQKIAKERSKREELQKKFDVLHRNQDPALVALGLELSKQSQKRIKDRKEKLLNEKKAELLLIVEGQKNSIEAIKVIQYLIPRKKAAKVELLNAKDRQRVESLLKGYSLLFRTMSDASLNKSKQMPFVKPAAPSETSSKKEISEKLSKKIQEKHDISSNVISTIIKDKDTKLVQSRVSVNAEILLHGIKKNIKSLGKNPIGMVAKKVIKKGLNLNPSPAGVSKKQKTRKEVSKALQSEILKFSGSKPSEIEAKKEVAQAKTMVNQEILKNVLLAEVSKPNGSALPVAKKSKVSKKTAEPKQKASSPVKAAPASPTKEAPVKASGRSSRRATKKSKSYVEDSDE